MTGKEKCTLLRQIRREIARVNNIPYQPDECYYPGDDCPGTCPKCDAEIRALEMLLNRKADRGERITLAGISLDTYRQQVQPGSPDFWSADFDSPTGIMEIKKEPPVKDHWHLDPDTLGIMMPVEPPLPDDIQGGMAPVEDDFDFWFSGDGDTIV